MLKLPGNRIIPAGQITLQPIHSQGSGGQNVNKVATAIHLRFDIRASSLPEIWKERLLAWPDQRISTAGVIIIKAQAHNSQEKNRFEALERLRQLILQATAPRRQRKATRPTPGSQKRRLENKKKRSQTKTGRARVDFQDPT
ncbi:MAG: aminoacyl-tRNA hydrolase [Thiothrix sp.]|nr:aminoacyl-tRNA hydrolase [Thiothrix sp.]HPQ93976.1 alternative ribosome rescue aminoacyl-tRNA hydrolase ArfB [Thiolinea sp.]